MPLNCSNTIEPQKWLPQVWFPDQRHQNHQEPVLDPTPDLLPPRRSSAGKESACNVEDLGSILGSGRSPGEGIGCPLQCYWASLVAQTVKSLPAMWETWVGKIRWRRERLPTPVFCPGEFHGVSESDMTERLSFSLCPKNVSVVHGKEHMWMDPADSGQWAVLLKRG